MDGTPMAVSSECLIQFISCVNGRVCIESLK